MAELSYIGSYAVRQVIGEGGFGKVYQAYQPFLDRQVAIKMLRVEMVGDLRVNGRFIEEARTIARLRHPNIVTVYEFGYIPTDPDPKTYMVMEYLPGETLHKRLVRMRLSLKEVISIIEQLAQGLDYAHRQGVVHRDLTPANVIFSASNEPVIVDFGLAQLLETTTVDEVDTPPEQTSLKGTPAYMAPEQVMGEELTPATDQYALAIIAYEMLTQTLPFAASKIYDSLMRRVVSAPEPIADHHDLPLAVDEVLTKALSPKPADRYPSAIAFAQALGEALLPDKYRPRVVLDPIQAAELKAARQTISGFMWGLAFAVLVISLFCVSLAIRTITNEDPAYLLWRGVDATQAIDEDLSQVSWVWFDSAAAHAGVQAGDAVPNLNSERYITTINGVPYNEYNGEFHSGDIISHPIVRAGETLTVSYPLEIASYWTMIIVILIIPNFVAYLGGLWLLRRWGVLEPNRLMTPLLLLTSLTIVSIYITEQMPYLDSLIFYIILAMLLHFVLIFPTRLPYIEKHPRVVGLSYPLVILGLAQFMFGDTLYIAGVSADTIGYIIGGTMLFVAALVKWGFHDFRQYPALAGYGMSIIITIVTSLGSTWAYDIWMGQLGEMISRIFIALGTTLSVFCAMYSYHRVMTTLGEANPSEQIVQPKSS